MPANARDLRDPAQLEAALLALDGTNGVIARLSARITALEQDPGYSAQRPTLTMPTRALDTSFTIDGSRAALVLYTVELTAPALVTGTSSALVQLLVDATPIAVVKNLLTVSLGILSLTMTSTQQKVLVGHVPAGSAANLASTTSNGGTATLVSAIEVLL